jgi:hypothetical protein
MTRLMVYGASDDLIEVREMSDPTRVTRGVEFDIYDTSEEAPARHHLTDGTVLKVWYGDGDKGIWRVEIEMQGSAGVVIVPAENDEAGIYTDIAYVTGPDLGPVLCICEGEEVGGL